MTYLAGLHVIGVKGLFHADWLGTRTSLQRLLLTHSLGRKSQPIPQHQKKADGRSGRFVFLTLPRPNLTLSCHLTHHPPSPDPVDLGQITSNCFSHSYVSTI
jgi:hypothetical protein